MAERHNTGGNQEFHYEKEDLERIRKTDTGSTKEFKKAYQDWQAKRLEEKRLDEEMRAMRLRLLLIAIGLLLAAGILVALMFWA
jgi:hypothetical protein